MKRFAAFLLALLMLFSLAACGEGGFGLKQDEDSDIVEGYIGDTMSTYWFDFVVNDAYSCSKYNGYAADAGYKLVVVTMSLKNTCGQSVDMWADDFVILWDGEDDYLDIPLPAELSDDQFPDEYVLGINSSKAGVLVFEVPENFRDFSIGFQEVFVDESDPTNEDGIDGKTFFVTFTAEEK